MPAFLSLLPRQLPGASSRLKRMAPGRSLACPPCRRRAHSKSGSERENQEDISEKDEHLREDSQGPEALRNSAREVQRGPAAPGCAPCVQVRAVRARGAVGPRPRSSSAVASRRRWRHTFRCPAPGTRSWPRATQSCRPCRLIRPRKPRPRRLQPARRGRGRQRFVLLWPPSCARGWVANGRASVDMA